MSDLRDLYQEFILDHGRKPRNFRVPEKATHRAHGHNPLCGDKITVFLEVDDSTIVDAAFQGSGCAICMASASVMTQELKGKTRDEFETLFGGYHDMLTVDPLDEDAVASLGKLGAFSGVRRFPVRVKCATLAWHTTRAALEQQERPVSTENDGDAEADGASSGDAATANTASSGVDVKAIEERVVETLKSCYDPEIPVDIYELGLIYEVNVAADGNVDIKMTLTSPACPVAGTLPGEVETRVRSVDGVADAKIELVWDPPWDKEMMSEAAKVQLGFF
jgi:nitrogen fixation NifU-like protein